MTYDPREWDWMRIVPEFLHDGKVFGGPKWPPTTDEWYGLAILFMISITLGRISYMMLRRAIQWGFLARMLVIAFGFLSFWIGYTVVRTLFPALEDTKWITLTVRTTTLIPLLLLNVALSVYPWPPAPERAQIREFFGSPTTWRDDLMLIWRRMRRPGRR